MQEVDSGRTKGDVINTIYFFIAALVIMHVY